MVHPARTRVKSTSLITRLRRGCIPAVERVSNTTKRNVVNSLQEYMRQKAHSHHWWLAAVSPGESSAAIGPFLAMISSFNSGTDRFNATVMYAHE